MDFIVAIPFASGFSVTSSLLARNDCDAQYELTCTEKSLCSGQQKTVSAKLRPTDAFAQFQEERNETFRGSTVRSNLYFTTSCEGGPLESPVWRCVFTTDGFTDYTFDGGSQSSTRNTMVDVSTLSSSELEFADKVLTYTDTTFTGMMNSILSCLSSVTSTTSLLPTSSSIPGSDISRGTNTRVAIGAGIGGGVAFLVVVIAIVTSCLRRARRRKREEGFKKARPLNRTELPDSQIIREVPAIEPMQELPPREPQEIASEPLYEMAAENGR